MLERIRTIEQELEDILEEIEDNEPLFHPSSEAGLIPAFIEHEEIETNDTDT